MTNRVCAPTWLHQFVSHLKVGNISKSVTRSSKGQRLKKLHIVLAPSHLEEVTVYEQAIRLSVIVAEN